MFESKKPYHYDTASQWYPNLPNLAGQLSWVEDEAGQMFFGYTERSLQAREIRRWSDGTVHETSTKFDAMDRVTRRQFPDGTYTERTYDGRGLVEGIGPFVSGVTWDANGSLTRAGYGNGVEEKRNYDARYRLTGLDARRSGEIVRSIEIGYSLGSLVESIVDRNAGSAAALKLDGQFEYDDRYRLLKATDATGETQWQYDDMANVLKVTSTHGSEHLNVENKYADPAGPERRTTFGKEAWKFDAAGRLLSDGTRELTWDAKGRLASVVKGDTTETYTYDHADARAIKVTKTGKDEKTTRYINADAEERDGKLVQYVYLGDMRLARFDGKSVEAQAVPAMGAVGARSGGQAAAFGWMLTTLAALMFASFGTRRRAAPFPSLGGLSAWLGRKPVALTLALSVLLALSCGGDGDKKGAPKGLPDPVVNLTAEPPPGVEITELPASAVFYAGDYQETPVALTNATGKVTERSSYHPYGAERVHDGKRAEPYGYVGNERDGVGLSDFGARSYRAEAGVFLKPDPVAVFEAESLLEEPIRLTAYTYGSGDSITRMDPSGKIFETAWDVASLVMGVVSLKDNIASGNYGWAAVDAVGIVLDGISVVAPGVPGGASTAIKAGREMIEAGAEAAAGLGKTAGKVADAKASGSQVLKSEKEFQQQYAELQKRSGGGGRGGGGGPKAKPGGSGSNNPEQSALIDMAKRDKKAGITKADAQAYKELGSEAGVRVRVPETHPNRPHGKDPHIHVGPVDHIPVKGPAQ